MRILVFGGTGFIGKPLVKKLAESGAELFVLYVGEKPQDKEFSKVYWINKDFETLTKEEIKLLLKGMDGVYYLLHGATIGISAVNPVEGICSSISLLLKFLEVCKEENFKGKIIYASSGGAVYGNKSSLINEKAATFPISDYGIQKLIAEKYLYLYGHQFSLDYSIVRIANPFGVGQRIGAQGIIPILIQNIYSEKAIPIWGTGDIVRDYIYIDDLVLALEKVLFYKGTEKIFNVGTGLGSSINQLIENIEILLNKKAKIDYFPERPNDVKLNILDISLIEGALDWKPKITLNQGLKATIDWYIETDILKR